MPLCLSITVPVYKRIVLVCTSVIERSARDQGMVGETQQGKLESQMLYSFAQYIPYYTLCLS
mgnify:CR=1 FL=1